MTPLVAAPIVAMRLMSGSSRHKSCAILPRWFDISVTNGMYILVPVELGRSGKAKGRRVRKGEETITKLVKFKQPL
jgi:hypothetical protein